MPPLRLLQRRGQVVEDQLHLVGDDVGEGDRRAAIGHMQHVALGHRLEQLRRHVHRGAVAGRGVGNLAGIGLAVVDELLDGLHRHRVRHHQHVGELHDARDRRGVADEIERQLLVERGRDRVVGRDEQQRVAVRRRTDRGGGGDIAAGAGAVFHHELLAEMVRQPLAHDARHDIDRAAGGEADQPFHRAVGIVGGEGWGGAVARLKSKRGRAMPFAEVRS